MTTIPTTSHVAVVILNYNGRAYLEQFLPSVYQTTYANCSFYIADNASTDDSLAYIQSQGFESFNVGQMPEAGGKFYIALPQNYGFAEGYNRALRDIRADYFVLLNSDVEVSADWLDPLVRLMDSDATIAACQPKILSYRDKTKFEHAGAGGGLMDKWGYPLCRGRVFDTVETDNGQYNDTAEIAWATGAAMVVRADLYARWGGLDGDFFAHMEEIDLCWRLKRAGFKIFYCGASTVWHIGGGTLSVENPRKTYLNFRNSLMTLYKNVDSVLALAWLIWLRLVLDGVAGLRFVLKGNFANMWAIVRAHWAFFGQLVYLKQKRDKFAQLLAKNAPHATFNRAGFLSKSVVFQYFARGKKHYKDII